MTRARVAGFVQRFGDIVLAAAVTAFTQVEIWSADDYLVGSKTTFALATLCMTVPLAFRRRAPLTVALIVAAALGIQVLVEPSPHPPDAPFLAWLVACYSVAAHAELRPALVGGGALVGAIVVWAARTGDDPVFIIVILAGFWFVGRIVRSRALLAEQLVREREERARLAVAEERTRIARELHDVVAHSLGVMVVQAGAERLHEQPGTAAHDALSTIEQTGRQALAEMARLVTMLRTSDSDSSGPQPGLGELAALLERVRETGLEVSLETSGEPTRLAAGLDVSAYRIVPEALTNTLRHSQSRHARVRLRWLPAALEIEIADDGVGPSAPQGGSGHGLVGIRERVALFGGALVTGRSDMGGYLLAARLPLSQP